MSKSSPMMDQTSSHEIAGAFILTDPKSGGLPRLAREFDVLSPG